MIAKEDVSALMKAVSVVIKEYVGATVGPLLTRIDALESELKRMSPGCSPEQTQRIAAGEIERAIAALPAPKEVDTQSMMSVLATQVDELVNKAVAAIPIPKDGHDGKDGIDGQSVDLEVVRTMIQEQVAQIPVPKEGRPGKDGRDGIDARGEKGEKGDRGDDAPPVNIDALLETLRVRQDAQVRQYYADLPKPQDGRDGRDGRDVDMEAIIDIIKTMATPGRDGKDGEPGRDALHIDPFPAIDLEKSYPRGTWAHHLGGLWLARRNTEPGPIEKSGWQNMITGHADLFMQQDEHDPRQFVFGQSLSSGPVIIKEFRIPCQVYQGVWADGIDYRQGDTVTWNGSLWHCNGDHVKTKPGQSQEWQLAVKEGRPGKDAKESKDPQPIQPVKLR